MRKLEGVVKEIVDEMAYLQRREARMRDTNGAFVARFCSAFCLKGRWAGPFGSENDLVGA